MDFRSQSESFEAEPVDLKELNLLILHYLKHGPCREAAQFLERELSNQQLLPERIDFEGDSHPGGYSELVRRHQIGPQSLQDLLRHVLRDASLGDPALLSVSGSSRDPGKLRSLLSLSCQLSGCATSFGRAVQAKGSWISHSVMMREAGLWRMGQRSAWGRFFPGVAAERVSCLRTVRGHKMAVYCVIWDRAGRRFATGSDDGLVKIWSAETALLISSCRGHTGEVTDFSVSTCNRFVASSSNDKTIRVWHFTGPKTGHPQCVLTGHTMPVSFLDFSKAVPNALLSSSFDGTCRIWNIMDASAPAVVLHPVPGRFGPSRMMAAAQLAESSSLPHPSVYLHGSRAAAARQEYEAQSEGAREVAAELGSAGASAAPQGPLALLCCSFSSCGSFIVAGGNDCSSYLWYWNISVQGSASSSAAARSAFPNLPLPGEVLQLTGHRNDICLVAFNHQSTALATASKDGNVLVWRPIKSRSTKPKFELWLCLKCEVDSTGNRSRPARRKASVPSVNQIAWTADDQRLVVGLSDSTVRVWSTAAKGPTSACDPSGAARLVHTLHGHTDQVHVLSAHPKCPDAIVSAGYDGRVIIWSLATGKPLKQFGTGDRGGTETDPVHILDGGFSPNGDAIIVSDVAGQATIYGTGSRRKVALAQYEQFFANDYSCLVTDSHGNVLDAEAQRQPHLITGQRLMDMSGSAYPEPYQSAFQCGTLEEAFSSGQLRSLIVGGGENVESPLWMLQLAWPPCISAAYWHAASLGLGERAIIRRVQEAQDRYSAYHQAAVFPEIGRLLSNPTTATQLEEPALAAPEAVQERQEQQQQQPPRAASAGRLRVVLPRGSSGALRPNLSIRLSAEAPVTRRAAAQSLEPPSAVPELRPRRRAGSGSAAPEGPQGQRQRRLFIEDDSQASEENSEADGNDLYVQNSDEDGEEDDSGEDEEELEDEDNLANSTDSSEEVLPQRRTRRQVSTRTRGSAAAVASSSRATRRRRRLTRNRQPCHRPDELTLDQIEMLTDEENASNSRTTRRRLRKRPYEEDGSHRRHSRSNRKKSRRTKGSQAPRNGDCYAWLLADKPAVPSSLYVPQVGDRVVYVKTSHVKYLESRRDKKSQTPWSQLRCSFDVFHNAEPCRITHLEYFIANDTKWTAVRCRLAFERLDWCCEGREFFVDLYNDHTTPDFLIPEGWFVFSCSHEWAVDDTCQIFFDDEGTWRAMVTADLGREKAEQDGTFDASLLPWDGVELTDRYKVVWESSSAPETSQQGTSSPGSHQPAFNFDNTDCVSPWEMLPEEETEESLVQEWVPRLEDSVAERAHAAVACALSDNEYFLFWKIPEPDARYGEVFYNAEIALPIGLDTIQQRLENSWYRSVEGLKGDLELLQNNARKFNEEGPVVDSAQRLAEEILAAAEGRASDTAANRRSGRHRPRSQAPAENPRGSRQREAGGSSAADGADGEQASLRPRSLRIANRQLAQGSL